MAVSLIAMRCRTADRFPGAPQGVEILAPLVGEALGVEPRYIGSAGEVRETRYEHDLGESRGCLLEAGGQIDDALHAGDAPLLLAADCAVSLTTLPAVIRNRPDARLLWLDAHGDYNTPSTSGSGYLGGMCLAGACGEWDAGLDGHRAGGAGGARRCPRPRSGRARAARGKRRDRDRREHGGDARGGQERARRRPRVHAPGPRRDRPRALPCGGARPGRAASGQAVRPARLGGRGLRAGRPRGHELRRTGGRCRSESPPPRPPCTCSSPFWTTWPTDERRRSRDRGRARGPTVAPVPRGRPPRAARAGAGSAAGRSGSRASTSRTSSPRASGSRS